MKKILSILLCFLIIAMVAGCSKNNTSSTASSDTSSTQSNSSNSTKPSEDSKLKVSVTLPDGWKAVEGSSIEYHYMKNTASFMVKEETLYRGDTLDKVADEAIEIFKKSFNNLELVGNREQIKVGGFDAVKLSFTCEVSKINMKYTYVYLFLNNKVCAITFGDKVDTFDSLSQDYTYILDHISFGSNSVNTSENSSDSQSKTSNSQSSSNSVKGEMVTLNTNSSLVVKSMSIDKTVYSSGENGVQIKVKIQLDGLSNHNSAWIGIIPSNIQHGNEDMNDQHDIDYKYLESELNNGEVTLSSSLEKGDYDVRVCDGDGEGAVEVAYISFKVD